MCIAEFDYSVKIDAQKVLKNRLKYPPPSSGCVSVSYVRSVSAADGKAKLRLKKYAKKFEMSNKTINLASHKIILLQNLCNNRTNLAVLEQQVRCKQAASHT